MTVRKVFTIMLVANLLTVALVTAAFQAGGVMASSAPRSAGDRPGAFDPNLVPYVPWMMNYQGILKDSGGAPLTGQYDLTFTIYRYDQATGYQSIWTETHNDVQITNGLFNVLLGSEGNPLRGDTFAGVGVNGTWDGDLELGVKVNGGVELSPRTKLVAVPYAYRAEYVNRFPAPHYDSGWVSIAPAETKIFTHNLGGNTDNYIVDVQFKSSGGHGVNHWFYGIDYDNNGEIWGAAWHNLTATSISVYRGGDDTNVAQVRVRIWRTE